MEDTDLIIVGAGPTGMFATFCAGLRDINSITLESLGTHGGQMIELYPDKMVYDVQAVPKMKSSELSDKMYEQSMLFNRRIEFDSKVTDIIPENGKFTVEVKNEKKYTAKSILICGGVGDFHPNKIGAEGEDNYNGKGVYYAIKSVDDFKDKTVAIIGGGDSAFDYQMQISPVCKKTYIIQHNNTFKAAESSVDAVKKDSKAEIIMNNDVKKINGDGNTVKSIEIFDNTSNTSKSIDVDAVVIAIGYKVNPSIFKSLPIETNNRYIKVDHNYKTSVDGVYAAGDMANVSDEPKFALISVGGAEAYIAINNIKKYISPNASLFGGHSSSLNL
ncbi:MAG: FAD-dependent pyridine nucleotide-disulfide oxidoreductase [Candidatus Parvarchaeum acidiphilum ARMAN-4]|jgi:thioredoxin reductase (NADPH)|uniref:Ferredoxin--NADP reductase n=1 Tax=Candidatus Parvarchaeum acidiphilum ARMAN-4 TaxID=662760 RepID=D2EEU9_PARA4|nr:MAG: FAD-dependent pyridine nucleotide-disulphide oxidoreductase [Candidatus Parvarchaeum acidiphilum ARMAN-4]